MQPTDDNHEELIAGCLRKDRRSQQRMYELFYGRMLAVCMRYTKNEDQAQDLVQEGFIKVFDHLGKYKHDGSFEGWVRRIFVNNAIDSFRRTKKDHILPDNDYQLVNLADDTDEHAFMDEPLPEIRPEDVLTAMQQLTPAYQMVFNLYVMEKMTHQDIADKLGINVGTSKSNLSKARVNMKKILSKQFKHLQ
ncbi:MAG: sigma-70 family RNA polymerase sigma factor [Flavobacteriales bacterium]|nr:sigma-70 family RNA polymerase sigma factor [Flavobacteriales bacterium]